jgi:hypothetical protein
MASRREVDPGHRGKKLGLQAISLACLAVGGLLTLIGLIDFASSFGDPSSGLPGGFVLLFIGVPLLGIGGTLFKFAFLGEIGRYGAGELAPVAKDTLDYIKGQDEVVCPSCGRANEVGSNFCEHCGAALGAPAPSGS